MTNYKQVLDKTSDKIKKIIESHEVYEIETENFGWENYRYVSKKCRLIHLEKYSDKNLSVLHLTSFPKEWSEDPIFGFDIIVTDKKPLASFCDWSPILNDKSYISTYIFQKNYDLPEWTKEIFSQNAIAIIPQEDELDIVCSIAIDSFGIYLSELTDSKSDKLSEIKNKQNFYCSQQHKNQSTMNVLKSKLGEDRAKYFMETILFPKIS